MPFGSNLLGPLGIWWMWDDMPLVFFFLSIILPCPPNFTPPYNAGPQSSQPFMGPRAPSNVCLKKFLARSSLAGCQLLGHPLSGLVSFSFLFVPLPSFLILPTLSSPQCVPAQDGLFWLHLIFPQCELGWGPIRWLACLAGCFCFGGVFRSTFEWCTWTARLCILSRRIVLPVQSPRGVGLGWGCVGVQRGGGWFGMVGGWLSTPPSSHPLMAPLLREAFWFSRALLPYVSRIVRECRPNKIRKGGYSACWSVQC